MFKNTAAQKLTVFAFADAGHATLDPGEPVTGDAANITCKIEQDDDGTQSAINDTNPTEVEDGQYRFDLTQAESNGDKLTFYPESSTAGVQVIALPSNVIYTRPPNFPDLGIALDGAIDEVDVVNSADVDFIEGTDATDYFDTLVGGISTILNRLGAWTGTGINTLLGAFQALLRSDVSAPSDIGGTFAPASHSTEAIGDAAFDPLTDAVDVDFIEGTDATDYFNSLVTTIIDKVRKFFQLLMRSDAGIKADNAAEVTEINADEGSGAGDFDNETDATEAIRDRGDVAWTGGGGAATIVTLVTSLVQSGEVISPKLAAQAGGVKVWRFAAGVDEAGTPRDLTGETIELRIGRGYDDLLIPAIAGTVGGGGSYVDVTVSGAQHLAIGAGSFKYSLRITSNDDEVIAKSSYVIDDVP